MTTNVIILNKGPSNVIIRKLSRLASSEQMGSVEWKQSGPLIVLKPGEFAAPHDLYVYDGQKIEIEEVSA